MSLRRITDLIRVPNLFIAALTILLVHFRFVRAVSGEFDFSPWLMYLCILNTLIIMAGGYLINDIYDQDTDRINGKNSIVGIDISEEFAWKLYRLTLLFSLSISVFILLQNRNIPLFFLFLLTPALLYLYSRNWKGTILLGNLVVAFLCAMVPTVPLIAMTYESFVLLMHSLDFFHPLVIYVFVAFFTTLLREITKDLEDRTGDQAAHYRTLAVVWPVHRGRNILRILIWGIITYLLLIFWSISAFQYVIISFFILSLILVAVWISLLVDRAHTSAEFGRVSRWLKYFMFLGLWILVLWP